MRVAYGWVHRAACILNNETGLDGRGVARRLRGLLGAMARHGARAGDLEPGIRHFLNVSHSYWPGLFHTYDVPDLPRTNNDLEHAFGSARYHERRATGRRTASPALVVRGQVRLVASVATRLRGFTAADLRPADLTACHTLRATLDRRRESRRAQARFRRDPARYLAALEQNLLQSTLPP